MISGIQSGSNNDWLRKKLLERQSQKEVPNANLQPNSNSVQNTQPQEQTNGTNQVQASDKVASLNPPQKAELPWGNLMKSLGLSPQGSKEADFSAIGEKISQMKTQATDLAQKTQVDNLQKQYDGYKAVAANMPTPPQAPQNQITSTPPEQMTGATQLGDLNKYLLVKKRQI